MACASASEDVTDMMTDLALFSLHLLAYENKSMHSDWVVSFLVTHHILGIVLTRQPARADAAFPPGRFQILRIVFVRDRARAASTRLHVISTEVFATGETEGTKSGARGSVRAAKNQRLDRRQKRKKKKEKKIKQIVSHLSIHGD